MLTAAKTISTPIEKKYDQYDPMLSASDVPAIHRNDELMAKMRPAMERFYYNPAKFGSYLDQLGIKYPNPPDSIRRPPVKAGTKSGS